MASIADIVNRGKGKAGAWEVRPSGENRQTLFHYSTAMLSWVEDGREMYVDGYSLGWGSVSDQNGMNTAFKVLGAPYYYQRAGGAQIVSLPRQ
jgi:hypothetical protein